MAKQVSIAAFVAFLTERCAKKDGYIMGATGQKPKSWAENSWWFTQYSGDQRKKALYWRANAERVWDCNGLSEGFYKDKTGVDINTRARYNYSGWCSPKGSGKIPNDRKVPGAAVFIHSASSGYITHVGYLEKPVDPAKPKGDWYVIEAQGVMKGVVRTKLNARGWNRWGWMTKYFDYTGSGATEPTTGTEPGQRVLKRGMSGSDVKIVQETLIAQGFDLGKWGADGDYGSDTEKAVKAFQKENGLIADGVVGEATWTTIMKLTKDDPEGDTTPMALAVTVTGGTVNVRSAPNTGGAILGTAKHNEQLAIRGEMKDGWYAVNYKGMDGWISGKYAEPDTGAVVTAKKLIVVTGSTVNVRAEVGTNGKILGTVKKNEAYPLRGDAKNGWYPIEYKGKDGWISGQYARMK